MKAEILKMLREADGYISGQEICEKFNVSRTAVWKVIRRLQEDGYEGEAVRNQGNRMVESPDILTKEEVESCMHTEWVGRNVVCYKVTDSTNLRIKQMGDEGALAGTLAVAEEQTAGRGRRGRSWESPAGAGIFMSVLLRPKITPDKASMLTIVTACSTAKGIKKYFENEGASCPDIQIKWPNDLVVNGKKLAGILTEMSTQIDYINYVTVGIGINANTKKFPEELKDHATSLYLECGHMVKRASVIASIMKCFEEDYRLFLETEDLSGLMETYMSMLVNRDRDVLVLDPSGTYKAKALGIDKNGELIVRREDGTSEHVYAGEVSVRGVYGYV